MISYQNILFDIFSNVLSKTRTVLFLLVVAITVVHAEHIDLGINVITNTTISNNFDEAEIDAVMDAITSTNLISEAMDYFPAQSTESNDSSYKITVETYTKKDGIEEYKSKSITIDEGIYPPLIIREREINILSNKIEMPIIVKPEKHIKKISFKQPKIKKKIVPYVDYVEIEGEDMPDPNAPILSDKIAINDPIEGFNRVMFVVDDGIYTYFLLPVGKGYRYVVPAYAREGFERMDYNIQMPKRLINNLFQLKFKGAGISFTRFMVNTTVGLVGFYDPAQEWLDLEKYEEDTGQTFAYWGIGAGCYLYLPVIGASTPRDFVGTVIDDQLDPRAWIPFGGSSIRFLMKFNNMTLLIDEIDRLKIENLDPYTLRRDIWYLIRQSDIAK